MKKLLVILVLGLLVLGPERLPEFARKIGNFIKEARRMSRSFQEELRNAVEDPDIEMKARAQGALLSQEQNSNDEPENQSS